MSAGRNSAMKLYVGVFFVVAVAAYFVASGVRGGANRNPPARADEIGNATPVPAHQSGQLETTSSAFAVLQSAAGALTLGRTDVQIPETVNVGDIAVDHA